MICRSPLFKERVNYRERCCGSYPSRLVAFANGGVRDSLTLNGNRWMPKGLVFRAFTGSPNSLITLSPVTYQAQQNYGVTELQAARVFGADTIRFLVSQPSLDPDSTLYSASFADAVVQAITLARQQNFVVLIAMQDESLSGDPNFHPLPSDQTVRNWDMLNTNFGNDRGVMFELYNEPSLPPTTDNWNTWAYGGVVPNFQPTYIAVGMQTLVTHLRNNGALNTFVLDGLDLAHSLDGFVALTDPLQKLAYAIHPYLDGSDDESQWDARYGAPSRQVPVFATEWSAATGGDPNNHVLGIGGLDSYQVVIDLLNYLRVHKIGVAGGGFDVPGGFMVQDVPGWSIPTNYDNYSPTVRGGGAGALVKADFSCQLSASFNSARWPLKNGC